jgi:hypothetical protein
MRVLSIIFFFCAFAVASAAQDPVPRMIDEFGLIKCDDYLARYDYMVIELLAQPDSRIYVLTYDGKIRQNISNKQGRTIGYKDVLPRAGTARAINRSIKDKLTLMKHPVESFVFIEGGIREYLSVEIWLVPPGASPPKASPTLTKMKYSKGKPRGFCFEMT